jgi:hypothetical protein
VDVAVDLVVNVDVDVDVDVDFDGDGDGDVEVAARAGRSDHPGQHRDHALQELDCALVARLLDELA